jgi:DNA segregation ATPase FtsK/SpoIIIE, S-DNA-T family
MNQGQPLSKPPVRNKADLDPEDQDTQKPNDLLVSLWLRFGRFGWDIFGLALLALALMTLLGLFGLTQGSIIDPWVSGLKIGMGWGSPFFIVALAIGGQLCLRKHFAHWPEMHLGRIVALELSVFALLMLFSIFGGISLDRAESGVDGGVIGWGLATLIVRVFPLPWGMAVGVVLLFVLIGYGTGIFQWAFVHIERWLERIQSEQAVEKPPVRSEPVEVKNVDPPELPEEKIPSGPRVRDPRLPPINLLIEELATVPDEAVILETGRLIEKTLAEFGLPVNVRGYRMGPTITQYAVEPGYIEKTGPDGEIVQQKVRVAQISALQRDLALFLSAERLRIEAPVPGRSYVGIEVPNPQNTMVRLRSVIQSESFLKINSPLAVVLGKDVSGQPVVVDLARMPHVLIAGTTGSGKSICISALVTCLAMNNTPERLRMALLDPKMVELSHFNGLPHLFGKVETEIDRMLGVLKWALMEMDNRYRLLEDARTRDIDTYNRRAEKRGQPLLPKIVLLVDELADLMMSAPDQTEHSLVRLAQMARAVGIHLVVATQRPSTDVVTGLIKANFPARLAFAVASSIDSRVILDTNGAESLMGKGDMLFLNPETGTPLRAQGVMVTDQEIEQVVAYWQKQSGDTPVQDAPWEDLVQQEDSEAGDGLVDQAIEIVKQAQRANASLLQRRLRIGYPRAARLIDELEERGIVGPSQGSGRDRDVLVSPDEDDESVSDESA